MSSRLQEVVQLAVEVVKRGHRNIYWKLELLHQGSVSALFRL